MTKAKKKIVNDDAVFSRNFSDTAVQQILEIGDSNLASRTGFTRRFSYPYSFDGTVVKPSEMDAERCANFYLDHDINELFTAKDDVFSVIEESTNLVTCTSAVQTSESCGSVWNLLYRNTEPQQIISSASTTGSIDDFFNETV